MNSTMTSTAQSRLSAVWDPLVRITHWLLVGAFATAYVTAEEDVGTPDNWHVWAGYLVGALVIVRVFWGFAGTRYARFSDFVTGPLTAFGYLRDLVLGQAKRYLGHSPSGGAMVIMLLACLAGTVATGVMANNGASVATATTPARADDEGQRRVTQSSPAEPEESAIGEVHGVLANVTLALVVLHLLGVGLASFVHRENLVWSMITGKKRAD
jgi:cytochrome b